MKRRGMQIYPTSYHTAYLSEEVFWTLLFSAAEVYKKECFGILMGTAQPKHGTLNMTLAMPSQSVERGYGWVAQRGSAHHRIESVMKQISHLSCLGHFHSHAGGPTTLSATDRKMLHKDGFHLLIDIRKKQRSMSWAEREDGSCSGTCGDYFYRLVGYVPYRKKERKVQLYCPCVHRPYSSTRQTVSKRRRKRVRIA